MVKVKENQMQKCQIPLKKEENPTMGISYHQIIKIQMSSTIMGDLAIVPSFTS